MPCRRQRLREWRAANPERNKVIADRWRDNNRERIREQARQRWAASPEIRANRATWQAANRDKLIAYQKAYRQSPKGRQRLLSKYGMSIEDYGTLVAAQDGKCPICHRALAEVQQHIDHCHDSGRVRGVLCQRCNQGLGLLGDSAEAVARAAEYLAAV